ncbi:GNAT family N-acetyltransferase [Actinomadura logoneensis]|uniref:GNAT family N-acetyltransferase n=1 Tax=Actinomadura logoneensis TaxID=2293572 RepID=A0A372J9T2_9ACTN|nr:GNAT family N-acetyltransferase [Actinomadura logoneensis]RFU36750.1 GNAT family N-acetyltransferase [Actinomadura logoneensis]
MDGWRFTGDPDAFDAAAGALLRADPARNTTHLTILDTLRHTGPHAYGTADPVFGWFGGAEPVAAFLCTPTFPILLTAAPDDAARALAETLTFDPSGVNAEPSAAAAFAAAWERRTGAVPWTLMQQRLYRLETLVPPRPTPPGAAGTARAADAPLVLGWLDEFTAEAGGAAPVAVMEERLRTGCVVLWEVDGEPVAMAGRTPALDGMSRVAPVYTRPAHRRRGYGAAVTAAVTRSALDAGVRHIVLFTDLSNPTSNGIYRAVGYRPVTDRLLLGFGEGNG